MEQRLEAEILAASQPLRVPGQGERRVLSPVAVERLAETVDVPRREVEAVALEAGVIPLHYLRNLARFEEEGQAKLLRATVAVTGDPVVVERLVELLALDGVGKVVFCGGGEAAERAEARLRNRNASCEFEARAFDLAAGASQALDGACLLAACLPDSRGEQLLQFACRMAKVPVILGGVEGHRGQATTVFPGDPGVALVYKPRHSHLSPERPPAEPDSKIALVVAGWLAEQVTAVILDRESQFLQHRLQYADLDTGEAAAYPL